MDRTGASRTNPNAPAMGAADVKRAYVIDEFTALTLGDAQGAAGESEAIVEQARNDEVTVHDWLHDRVLTRAGVADHLYEGLALHRSAIAVPRPPLGKLPLGQGGSWGW